MKTRKFISSFIASLFITTSAFAVATPGQNNSVAHMSEFGITSAPIGHVQFCQHNQAECAGYSEKTYRVKLTQDRWDELVMLNAEVNRVIIPQTDMQIYAVPEFWTYPTSVGDCEDYVLLKKKLLIDRGWHPSALRITVVLDENGEGHAVLTVSTDRGDVILDNVRNEVLMWNKTKYTYIKRQSGNVPSQWVSLSAPQYAAN